MNSYDIRELIDGLTVAVDFLDEAQTEAEGVNFVSEARHYSNLSQALYSLKQDLEFGRVGIEVRS